ncbi:MAG: metallophosphoesterase [Ignavibacterium sp.]|nr:metallophosphoesterase [Ignavibacterium sp.]MDW8374254.1 metallophosphoesterase [Ignavibacteriales bacterium]
MTLFFITFFTLYTALNYYVFIKAYVLLPKILSIRILFIIVFILISYGYVISKILYKFLPILIYDIWLTIGALWFAMLVYFVLSLFALDIILLLNKFINFIPSKLFSIRNKEFLAIFIFILVVSMVGFGNLNKRDIKVKKIEIDIPRYNSKIDSLNLVFASDIHLSPIDGEKLLPKIVDKINSIQPDIILFGGDIVDDKAEILEKQSIGKSFLRLKSKYGIFTVNGNHEFINGIDGSINYAEKLKMKVLRDTAVLIDQSFYIIGRDDTTKLRFEGKNRKSLGDIIKNLDAHPKILIDHTPLNLSEAERNNIDLQLSGHTHHGQIWPGNLITSLIYEVSWGYKKKGNTHFYVTSGAGTWGPPVRIGSKSEIVQVKINFK